MKCIFPAWGIIVIVITAVIIVIAIVIINRKWETIKFFMFMRYGMVPNDDGPENLDEMDFDTFVTYR